MITQGLSKHEITLITQILDEHGVQYQVGATGGAEGAVVRGGRGDASFYAIEIPGDEFNKLPADAKARLEGLGIYPEVEVPDFSEESPKKEKSPEEKAALKKSHKKIEIIFISALVIGFLLFVRKVLSER